MRIGAVGWSAVCNCGISGSYSLTFWFNNVTFKLQFKVSKEAKIRNRYNQIPHPTQDTTRGKLQNTTKHRTQESQERALSKQVTRGLHWTDKKAWQTRNINNKNDPQKKHRLGMVDKIFLLGGFN